MVLLQWALITLQPLMAEAAALVAGMVITIHLTLVFVRFIHSIFE